MEMGDRIRAARISAGLSQRGLAAKIKASRGLIGAWETYLKKPGRDALAAVAAATHKDISYFYGRGPDAPAKLEISDPDEIALINLYRQLLPRQQKSHLDLFRESVALRQEIEQQSRPANGKRISA